MFKRGKRGPRKRNADPKKKEASKAAKLYFNSNTQAAIVSYQRTSDPKERNRLYETEISPAFVKLAENLINIHKFTGLHDSYDDLKNDCVCFLVETIHKFDGTRGTNAFSYFNVVAKNWLIIRAKQKTQRARRSVSLDDPDSMSKNDHSLLEEHGIIPSQEDIIDGTNAVAILELLRDIRAHIKTECELACIDAIIAVFEQIDEIDLLNKSAVLLYVRELSGLTPKQLTTAMQLIKKHYKRLKTDPRYQLI